MEVVLAAGSSGILLHEAIGHGMEADFNRKNISIFSDKIGKKVAKNFVTIVDNGTNLNLRGSINIDDEGNDTEETILVENGTMVSYLHDKISAEHYGVKPTGNGPDVLKNITMVGNDLKMSEGGWTCGKGGQGVPVSQGLPTIKVSGITVGGVS